MGWIYCRSAQGMSFKVKLYLRTYKWWYNRRMLCLWIKAQFWLQQGVVRNVAKLHWIHVSRKKISVLLFINRRTMLFIIDLCSLGRQVETHYFFSFFLASKFSLTSSVVAILFTFFQRLCWSLSWKTLFLKQPLYLLS